LIVWETRGYDLSMSFFAILLALLIEQARPLGAGNAVHRAILTWVQRVRHSLDAGRGAHAWLAWSVAVLLPALVSAGVYLLLWQWSGVLAFAWMVLILYLTLGFRQFSHHFTAIREALESGDEARAREELTRWRDVPVDDFPRHELLRHVIEYAMLQAHRHVFGVLVACVVLSLLGLGPAGAVLYRLSEYVSRKWRPGADEGVSSALAEVAARTWFWVDALPVRVTAVGLAVVGNFEEAVASWRQDARHFPDPNDGIVLAATSGAINVRLGGRALAPDHSGPEGDAPVTDGREPQLAHLGSVVGLVWRSVVLWLLLLGLGVVSSWV